MLILISSTAPACLTTTSSSASTAITLCPGTNWSLSTRLWITLNVSLQNLYISFCSSCSSTISFFAPQFHCTKIVATLGLVLYALALGFGPLLWQPMSKVLDRTLVFIMTFVPLLVSHLECISAPNITTLLVCRIIRGLFSCSVATNAGGTLADIWMHKQRAVAIVELILFELHGPVLGPIVGGL